MDNIDFTEWTDAQLASGADFASASPHGPALLAEIERRKDAGVWMTDGSTERVTALVKSARTRKLR